MYWEIKKKYLTCFITPIILLQWSRTKPIVFPRYTCMIILSFVRWGNHSHTIINASIGNIFPGEIDDYCFLLASYMVILPGFFLWFLGD